MRSSLDIRDVSSLLITADWLAYGKSLGLPVPKRQPRRELVPPIRQYQPLTNGSLLLPGGALID